MMHFLSFVAWKSCEISFLYVFSVLLSTFERELNIEMNFAEIRSVWCCIREQRGNRKVRRTCRNGVCECLNTELAYHVANCNRRSSDRRTSVRRSVRSSSPSHSAPCNLLPSALSKSFESGLKKHLCLSYMWQDRRQLHRTCSHTFSACRSCHHVQRVKRELLLTSSTKSDNFFCLFIIFSADFEAALAASLSGRGCWEASLNHGEMTGSADGFETAISMSFFGLFLWGGCFNRLLFFCLKRSNCLQFFADLVREGRLRHRSERVFHFLRTFSEVSVV